MASMIRLVLLVMAIVSGVAIFLGRANPVQPNRRTESAVTHGVLNRALTDVAGGGPRLLEFETGRLEMLPRRHGSFLDRASLSPWEDRGRRQVVGFGSDQLSVAMIRISLPEGELLDRVDFAEYALPVSAPCWFPGTLAKILYAGADGRIYRVDFEKTGPDGEVANVPEARPEVLNCRVPMLANGEPRVHDLSWPEDSRLGGRILATVCFKGGPLGLYIDWQIWWLELDRDGTTIQAAGPLLQPTSPGQEGGRRLPTLINVGGEVPSLAYLAKISKEPGHQVRIAPLRFDPGTGVPLARESEARILARGCSPVSPAASPDGRWVTVVRPDGPGVKPERVALDSPPTLVARFP